MIVKGNLKDCVRTFKNELIISFITNSKKITDDDINSLYNAKNGLKIDITQWREKRSLNANSYAWVLMDKIAEKIKSTKEDVYREIIKRVGVFEVLPIKEIAVNKFIKRWQSKGLGWVCDNLGACKTLKGYVNIIAYYGTSTYDTREMARFIDEVVNEAKSQGIQTETPEQIEELKSLWREYEINNAG